MSLHNEIMNIKSEPYKHASVSWKDGYNYGHRAARHAAAELALKADELLEVTIAMRDYIDALPKDLVLPAMPGFDRDWADDVIANINRGS